MVINVKKIMYKVIIILIFISIFEICMPNNYSHAGDDDPETTTGYAKLMKGNISTDIDTGQLRKIIGRVIGAIQVISGLFAVITIALIGFEYIMQPAPDMRKELQKKGLPILISVIFIFGAVSIAQFVIGAFE